MITVIGLGFVGLTTALGFAKYGFKTYGYDIDNKKKQIILDKKIPFYEKGLDDALESYLGDNFILADSLDDAVSDSNVIFLCVGTPCEDGGCVDLKHIKSAIDNILEFVKKNDKKIIVIKSTVPPTTLEKDIIPYVENKGFKVGVDIFLANNPEFLREGCAWDDFIYPDRIVVGCKDDYTKQELFKIYSRFDVLIHFVAPTTAEFIKYLSNTFLATLISFSNEMSIIADSIGGIDVKNAFKILHQDKRWFGTPANIATYTYPGCGFGGYCLPKDTQALISKAKENNYQSKILENVLKVNSEIKQHWVSKICASTNKEDKIAILGLSFKPQSDDVRQSASYNIIKLLIESGFLNIVAYDPVANKNFDTAYQLPIKYANNLNEALDDTKTIIIATAWQEFIENKELFKDKNVFDLRYVL